MRKLFLTIILLAIMLCGCGEEKLQCDCCQTYKVDSQIDYYEDENMSICKDCEKYALSTCRYCKKKYVTSRNEYNSHEYCLSCIYDGNVTLCGYCGDITENDNMYYEEYCGNCVVSGYDLEVCDVCGKFNFSHGTIYTEYGIYCVECFISSQK